MITLIYWDPCVAEPSGHCALQVGGDIVSFWPHVAIATNEMGPVPSRINTDFELEKFTAGIRSVFLEDLERDRIRLPSGIFIYAVLFDMLKSGTLHNAKEIFDDRLRPYSETLGDHLDLIKSAAIFLANWLNGKQTKHPEFLTFLLDKGARYQRVDLDFLNKEMILKRLAELKALEDGYELLWYPKVGAMTDSTFNRSGRSVFSYLFLPGATGRCHYRRGRVRHNCASFILDLLLTGGLQNYLVGFSEKDLISPILQESIRFNAASYGTTAGTKDLMLAGCIGKLSWGLSFFGYSTLPITNWFGTTPRVLYEASLYARTKSGISLNPIDGLHL